MERSPGKVMKSMRLALTSSLLFYFIALFLSNSVIVLAIREPKAERVTKQQHGSIMNIFFLATEGHILSAIPTVLFVVLWLV